MREWAKNMSREMVGTLMATGYTVQPTSKLPFLNIITDVLFMQVPADNTEWSKEIINLSICLMCYLISTYPQEI